MRKVILQMQTSVDGFVSGPNGNDDWIVTADDDLWGFINAVADGADTLLLGRKMAQGFGPHFEAFTPDHPRYGFAQKMVNLQKLIFSQTLDKPVGWNARLAEGSPAEEIARLKQSAGRDILVYGGVGFVSSLVSAGLVDEFLFFVNPVWLNGGVRIEDRRTERQPLALVGARPYACGVTVLHYRTSGA